MRAQDLNAIWGIEQATQKVPWSLGVFVDCMRSGYPAWVAEELGETVGFIFASQQADEFHIMNVAVKPDRQNQGIGRKLMLQALCYAKEAGMKLAFLEVRPSNAAAIALYRDLGFNEIGLRKHYYPAVNGKREDAMQMGLDLTHG